METETQGRWRIATVPNALSVLRLALIPLFLWLLLDVKADGWAFWILMFSGFTDWADGKLARLLNQSSRLGELLDPLADRLYIVIIPVAFAIRGIIPWWIIAVIVARDVLLFASGPLLRSRGLLALPVLYIGKAATFALMSHVLHKRTYEGREATSLVRRGMNQNEAAATLGISKQAMSQRLQAAGWPAEQAGWQLALNLITRAAGQGE